MAKYIRQANMKAYIEKEMAKENTQSKRSEKLKSNKLKPSMTAKPGSSGKPLASYQRKRKRRESENDEEENLPIITMAENNLG